MKYQGSAFALRMISRSFRAPGYADALEAGEPPVSIERATNLLSRADNAGNSNSSAARIADTLRHAGLGIVVVSIVASVIESVIISRQLSEPEWLSRFSRITPYSLWAGVLVVFAGIVMRDRTQK